MTNELHPKTFGGKVSVHLLDPVLLRPIKSWTFSDSVRITIGRASDQDIELNDPYVSRNHADLQFQAGRWRLISRGRNGVLVAGELVTDFEIDEEVRFRLGSQGPSLRFSTAAEAEASTSTILIDTLPTPEFRLDESRLHSSVKEIADGDYFQDLQQRAKLMRRQRDLK